MIITKTPTIEGQPIKEYGEVIYQFGTADFLGKIKDEVAETIKIMGEEAEQQGYNAIVNLDVQFIAPIDISVHNYLFHITGTMVKI